MRLYLSSTTLVLFVVVFNICEPAQAAKRNPDGTLMEPASAPRHHRPHRAPVRQIHRAPPRLPAPAKPPAAPVPQEEAIEEVESVEPVDVSPAPNPGQLKPVSETPSGVVHTEQSALAAAPAGPGTPLTWFQVAGHLHAAMVHLPIAWTMLWAGVELLGPPLGLAPLAASALPLGLVTCASFIPSVVSGLARLGELGTMTGYEAGPALLHRNLMFVAAGVLVFAFLLRCLWSLWPNTLVRRIYVFSLVVAFSVVGFSAHLGGRLVYGDDFLPF